MTTHHQITGIVETLNARNRMKFVGINQWFSVPEHLQDAIQTGKRVSVFIRSGSIHEVYNGTRSTEIDILYREIDYLASKLDNLGVDVDWFSDRPVIDMNFIERNREATRSRKEYCASQDFSNEGLKGIAFQRDSYVGVDGKRYVSAGKTEHFDSLWETFPGERDVFESYHGI